MIVLSLCDHTGNWSRPWEEAGYVVERVDLQDGGRDVRFLPFRAGRVAVILAAPPCTMFAASGARWERTEREMADALALVDACLRAVAIYQPLVWALENPVGKLRRYLGPPALTFHPSEYAGYPGGEGDNYTKKTLLWGRFRPPVKRPVEATDGSRMHRLAPSPERAALRSATPAGFARAFFDANDLKTWGVK